MFELSNLMLLIPALPLGAALLTAALGKTLLRDRSHLPAVAAIAASCLLSLVLVAKVREASIQPAGARGASQVGYEKIRYLWTWADLKGAYVPDASQEGHRGKAVDLRIDVTLRADPLTAMMLAMVTFISTLVAVYSIGYMQGDPGYWRFFTYIALFVFSMTMLVSASNFALLYVFWEAVGVCSYLLIGFWYQKPEAAAAGKKAFLVNRIGDFGFALGVFLIWVTYQTLDFHDTPTAAGVLGQSRLAEHDFVRGGVGLAICLLLFLGACGKSAQFPLHVWLPDAMEGPTPVSALIHAATMVTAGVYLVARCAPLFAAVDAGYVVAAVGCFTAVLAGVIAVTQTDLKRVLAYSTVSQLGFMFLALGTGTLAGTIAGMFHLFTHAFFKALLFLGAGSVMHAMGGVIDMRRFGGLAQRMPVTRWTFLIGCLALAGVVPFAGFWSKDQILAEIVHVASAGGAGAMFYQVLGIAALFAAFLTAFYTFRAYCLTFHGAERIPAEAGHHAHESPRSMTGPLVVLAVFAAGIGAWCEWTGALHGFLEHTPSLAYSQLPKVEAHEGMSHLTIGTISTLVALAGVGLGCFFYLGDRREAVAVARILSPLYWLSYGKFFFDQIYQVTVIWPLEQLARLCYWIDRRVIDGLVDFCGRIPPALGSMMRALQIGLVQFYALAMVLGLLVLIGALLGWPVK